MIRSEVAPELISHINYSTEFINISDDIPLPDETEESV